MPMELPITAQLATLQQLADEAITPASLSHNSSDLPAPNIRSSEDSQHDSNNTDSEDGNKENSDQADKETSVEDSELREWSSPPSYPASGPPSGNETGYGFDPAELIERLERIQIQADHHPIGQKDRHDDREVQMAFREVETTFVEVDEGDWSDGSEDGGVSHIEYAP